MPDSDWISLDVLISALKRAVHKADEQLAAASEADARLRVADLVVEAPVAMRMNAADVEICLAGNLQTLLHAASKAPVKVSTSPLPEAPADDVGPPKLGRITMTIKPNHPFGR